jgi:uncharacterized protein (DUF934 family)
MRQIIKDRQVVADDWTYAGSEEAAAGKRVVLPLSDYLAVRAGGPSPVPGAQLAVKLLPADDEETLRPYLAELPLIVVEFPSSAEGRGYTQGRLLRERLGFRGELRAAGGVHLDQMYFLARCGFDAFDLAAGEKLDLALAELQRFSVAYQDSAGSLVHPRRRFDAGSSAS